MLWFSFICWRLSLLSSILFDFSYFPYTFSVVFWGLWYFFLVGVVGSSAFRWILLPEKNLRRPSPCFDGGDFCYWSGKLFRSLFPVFFWGLRGGYFAWYGGAFWFFLEIGAQEGFFGVFPLLWWWWFLIWVWKLVLGPFLWYFLVFGRTLFNLCVWSIYFWVRIGVWGMFWGGSPLIWWRCFMLLKRVIFHGPFSVFFAFSGILVFWAVGIYTFCWMLVCRMR